MPSYRLLNETTGMCIPGYQVLSATEEEIGNANRRLISVSSTYRLVPVESRHTQARV